MAVTKGHLYDLHTHYALYCHRTKWMWYRGEKNEGAQRSKLRAGFKWSSKVMDCRFDQLSGPENFPLRFCFVRRVCRPGKVPNCGYFEREREF